MMNPDGVFLGNNRCNLVGQDLNRCWNVSSEFSSPTILATKNMLKELDSSEVRVMRRIDEYFADYQIYFLQFNNINEFNLYTFFCIIRFVCNFEKCFNV